MSNEIIIKLEEGLYEDYKEELEKKYFGGITAGGPDKVALGTINRTRK